ncbi:MAG: hypothetical protein HYZ16_10495, partial [Bacteroidetes bacterium]|nr:hypothetical protein [Bacteroidota bacterium]
MYTFTLLPKRPGMALWLFALVASCTLPLAANAQFKPQYDNTGGTTPSGGNSIPFSWNSAGVRGQMLIPANAFTDTKSRKAAPGGQAISKLYIYPTSGTFSSPVTYTSMVIKIGQPSITSLSTTWHTTDMTTVVNQSNYQIKGGMNQWCEVPLTIPFNYDPKKPLLVDVSWPSQSTYNLYYIANWSATNAARNYASPSTSASASGSSSSFMYLLGMDLVSLGPNNAGVVSIDSPTVFCGGTQSVYATIGNFGTNQIDTLTVNWKVDGVAQKPILYTNLLDTPNGKGKTEAQIFLGKVLFNTNRTITVSTANPNNITDTVTTNDSLQKSFGPSLSGRFTIGTNGDYKSFSAAAADLSAYGVCGPVEFIVRPGTYTEKVSISTVLGASATNTIKFKSAHIDSVTLQYTGSTTGDNTLTLSGADYMSFENMRILANGSTYGWAVHLTGAADYNSFNNCVIQASLSSSSSSSIALVASGSSTSYSTSGNNANYNTFTDCQIRGGYFNCVMYGGGSTAPIKGNSFYSCKFEQGYYYGVYMYYGDSLTFHDNTIKDFRYTYNYGMLMYYQSNFDIQRNYARCEYYNYLAYANYYNYNGKQRSMFANNVLISTGTGSSYSHYGYYMSYTNFWHNSLFGRSSSYMCYWYYMTNNDIRNNIFHYEGTGYLIYTYNPTFVEWDYNDYYKTGGNLAYISGSVYSNAAALKGWNPGANQHNWELDPAWVQKDEDHHLTSSFPNMFGPYVGV